MDGKDSSVWILLLALAMRTEPSRDPRCSERVQPLVVCTTAQQAPSLHASTSQMDKADSLPARFYKEATGPESSEDEFGILVDDRCIDTGVFQPRYLVHELVFACSPLPPRPRLSHIFLDSSRLVVRWPEANWAFSQLSRPWRQVFECSCTNLKSGHGAQKQRCAHEKSQSSQHFPSAQQPSPSSTDP